MDFENFLLGVRNVWDKLQALGATCGAGQHVRQEVWMSWGSGGWKAAMEIAGQKRLIFIHFTNRSSNSL